MEALLHNIFLAAIYILAAYGTGVALRFSSDIRLLFGIIFGFVFFSLTAYVMFLGVEIHIPKPMSTLLWVAAFCGPLGYISGGPVLSWLDDKTESILGSDAFDETYRKYAQANKKRHQDSYQQDTGGYHGYHEWRQKTYRRASEDGHTSSEHSHRRQHHNTSPNDGLFQKEKMHAALGLDTQNVSAPEIKSAYRKLARKYHPDMLASQNLSEAEIEKAMKRMQSLNAAYEWFEDNGLV